MPQNKTNLAANSEEKEPTLEATRDQLLDLFSKARGVGVNLNFCMRTEYPYEFLFYNNEHEGAPPVHPQWPAFKDILDRQDNLDLLVLVKQIFQIFFEENCGQLISDTRLQSLLDHPAGSETIYNKLSKKIQDPEWSRSSQTNKETTFRQELAEIKNYQSRKDQLYFHLLYMHRKGEDKTGKPSTYDVNLAKQFNHP